MNFSAYNPSAKYSFPSKVEYGKLFQYHYLKSFCWLGYSVQLDGCLCLPCCLFRHDSDSVDNFVHKPYSNWTKFNDKIKAHSASLNHVKCVQALEGFKHAQSGRQPTTDTSLSTSRQKFYELNCKKLDAIIECVVLCGTQNIPLCYCHFV